MGRSEFFEIRKFARRYDRRTGKFIIDVAYKTKTDITDRTVKVAEAFGLGVDGFQEHVIYDNVELKIGPADIVYDLGSGDGRIVVEAARRRRARAVGIEADPLRVLWSQLFIALLNLRNLVRIVWGNFFHQSISDATVVTLFLTQRTNQRLKAKLQQELRPGTRVVSHVWTFDGWSPSKVDTAEKVYMYVMGQCNRSSQT